MAHIPQSQMMKISLLPLLRVSVDLRLTIPASASTSTLSSNGGLESRDEERRTWWLGWNRDEGGQYDQVTCVFARNNLSVRLFYCHIYYATSEQATKGLLIRWHRSCHIGTSTQSPISTTTSFSFLPSYEERSKVQPDRAMQLVQQITNALSVSVRGEDSLYFDASEKS